jgi:hypothetical protein
VFSFVEVTSFSKMLFSKSNLRKWLNKKEGGVGYLVVVDRSRLLGVRRGGDGAWSRVTDTRRHHCCCRLVLRFHLTKHTPLYHVNLNKQFYTVYTTIYFLCLIKHLKKNLKQRKVFQTGKDLVVDLSLYRVNLNELFNALCTANY